MMSSAGDTRIVYKGGFDTSSAHLREFFKDDVTNITAQRIIETIGDEGIKCFFTPKVSFNDEKELDFNIRVNPNAYTGHYTSKLISRKTSETNVISRNIAKLFYKQLHKFPIKNFYLWDILGREKDIKIGDYNRVKDVGTRAVMATEDPMKTLLMWFSQKIQLALDTNDSKTFHLKGEFNSVKYAKIVENENEYDYKLDADWTSFDANCDSQYIIAACALLLDGLPDDKLHRNIKKFITISILTKYVAVPPGVVVELNRGVPSGHPFTTLVNCTINTIYWCMIGKMIYGDDYINMMKIEVYGDDTYVYFKYHENLFRIDTYIIILGIKSELLSDKLVSCKLDYEEHEQPDFLKRRFSETGIKWNYKKMFDKFFYQSRKRDIFTQIELVTSFYETAPLDEDIKKFIKDFYFYLKESVYYDKISRSKPYLHLEELVNLGDKINEVFKKFKVSEVNMLRDDYFSRFTSLLSMSFGYILSERPITVDKLNINYTQIMMIYFIAFPPDFTVKNKFIYDDIMIKPNYERMDDSFFNNKDVYIQQMNNKIFKDVIKFS